MSSRNRGLAILIGIVVVAVIGVFAIIAIGNNANTGAKIDFSQIPQSRGADGAFVLGHPEAPVTLIEFADFVCPHCVTYESTISQFIERFVVTGQAKLEYRMFPTAGGDLTRFAGQIAECAEDQREGGFWQAYPLLYDLARTGQYSQDLGQRVANQLGLNYAELLSCSTTAEQVNVDVAFGRDQSVTGTPAVRVRYGDGPAQPIVTANGQTVTSGGPDIDVLAQMVQSANS